MIAYDLLRRGPLYRAEAINRGLKVAGYDVVQGEGFKGDQTRNVLCIWNRYAQWHNTAMRFEALGGRVFVFENGYIGRGGASPKFQIRSGQDTGHYLALSVGFHNGAGKWPAGGPERWRALGIELKPWRTDGSHILVCPNRAFGVPGYSMPADWARECSRRLRTQTTREVRVRPHPGNDPPIKPLDADLVDCHCMVIWNSSAGVYALTQGIPVVSEAPAWIMKDAASINIDAPELPDRLPVFERMAWAQFTIEEVSQGVPFRYL